MNGLLESKKASQELARNAKDMITIQSEVQMVNKKNPRKLKNIYYNNWNNRDKYYLGFWVDKEKYDILRKYDGNAASLTHLLAVCYCSDYVRNNKKGGKK